VKTACAAEVPRDEDYNQWKRALGTNIATAARHLTALPGFTVELIRSAQPDEGSWIAMTFDPRGRVIIAREDRGLLRLTLPANAAGPARVETINTNLLECRGLLFAYDSLYANANNSRGLYRLRDTDGDDQFDEVKLLRATPGGVGHGRNQLALGPDGMIYSIHGDDVGLPAEGVATNSPLQHYGEDRLLPRVWDKHLFNASASMPYGHLIRTDCDGRVWEVVAGGLRNPFGIAFNEAGDLFTYDADMEWDVGMPWYHPTRVLHLVPGGDYGWRRGTGVLPVWSPDTLPSVVDIGLGSPTAVQFGTKSSFPEPWCNALFILDWAYGKIYAVHLERSGATYAGRSEVFLKGRPLNVTGLDFGPDGAMYFVTGGRRTQSSLYRVRWNGDRGDRQTRREEDQMRGRAGLTPRFTSLEEIWPRLNDPDLWVRYQARVALERFPAQGWRGRALAETNSAAAFTALLALSRVSDAALRTAILNRLHELSSRTLAPDQQLLALRTFAICCIRLGRPEPVKCGRFVSLWEPRYPAADARVNQALCEMLVYLGSTNVVRKTLPLFDSAMTQQEKLHYLSMLSLVKSGWSIEERRTFFEWLGRARREFVGASMLPTALNYFQSDAEAGLWDAERAALTDTLAALRQVVAPARALATNRRFVKDWTMNDFSDLLAATRHGNAARGSRLFNEAGCAQCHRFGGEGGVVGPDLTAVGSRLDRRALLESIVEPSKVVAEAYRIVTITTKSGAIIEGRIVTEDANALWLAVNPLDPIDDRRRVAKADLASQRVSELSPMPTGLLNTLAQDEVLDLLVWLESGAKQ
jgi:putative heme-binding domain-containing protein